ncbi:hypothetical protein [Trichloromonas acetexigens]|uniref:DUF481 domain-containing protein n=1 Tax=Trichloromonas acetexigens TaxID=38815 RepID=A0A550JLD8_9BACT|nr:hypothetical protein [Desulfuromonas acetexigens]TRO84028.1 hypothetical protein FL622_02280 [Desulfuromonas acetexigens]
MTRSVGFLRIIVVCITLLLLLQTGTALAEEETGVDALHRQASLGLLASAHWLDNFFADPRFESEQSKTRLKVRFSLFAEDESDVEYDVRAALRLDLPILEDRLHLLIAGDPDEEDGYRAISGAEGTSPTVVDNEEDFSLSLRYFIKRKTLRHLSLRSGLRWRDGMPAVFLEPRYRRTIPLDDWTFRFTQRLTTITDGTIRARTLFDFDRQVRDKLFFRTTAEGVWDKDDHGYAYGLGFSLYQPFSRRRTLVYGWSNGFVTHPHHRLENVTLSLRYRQRIWRDWLFYEVVPQVSFPREEDYEVTPGILLRLELVFGYYPKIPQEETH